MKPGEIFDVTKAKLGKLPGRNTPKIVGALEVSETPPKTLDSRSPVEPTVVETRVHMDAVTVREHVRSKPKKKGEPEVRVRTMGKTEREEWNRVKRAEEE